MHDHEKRGRRYCPEMKEYCTKGWTKSMGYDDVDGEKIPRYGICAAWQAVTMFNEKENNSFEVEDCSIYGWLPDLITELSGRVVQTTQSMDKTANEVAKFHGTTIATLPDNMRANLLAHDPRRKLIPKQPEPLPQVELKREDENGKED